MIQPLRPNILLPGLLILTGCWETPTAWDATTPAASPTPAVTPTPTPETPTPETPTPEICFDLIDQDGDGADTCALTDALSLVEGAAGDNLGQIAVLGYLNDDEFAEIALGSEEGSDGQTSESGVIYIYKGGPSPYNLSTPDVTIYGNSEGGYAGRPASGGDINNDGFGDVLIGARGEVGPGSLGTGRVHLLCGASDGFSEAQIRLSSTSTDATFSAGEGIEGLGFALAGGGDINGDGYQDIALAAYANDGSSGTIHIIFGGEGWCGEHIDRELPTEGDITITSSNGDLQPGSSIAFVSDLDADGQDELLIGAPGTLGAAIPGRAYLLFGAATFETGLSIDLEAGEGVDIISYSNGIGAQRFGGAVHGGGDVDGDGKADLLIGAPGPPNSDEISRGAAYLVTEHTRPSGTSTTTLPSQENPAFLGLSVSDNLGAALKIISDVDGDQKDDILLGVPGLSGQGGAYLLRPFSQTGSETPIIFQGEEGPGGFGLTLAGVDSDGPERQAPTFVLIGGPRSGSAQGGAAYLYAPPVDGGAPARLPVKETELPMASDNP